MEVQTKSDQNNALVEEATGQNLAEATDKREFVEPEISQPVDVLEATTFFQLTDSGSTN